jgi:hypothetical protein
MGQPGSGTTFLMKRFIFVGRRSLPTVGDKSHSTRSKEEIQKSNKVQTDKKNDQIRIMIISEV